MPKISARRELKVRQKPWVKPLTQWLVATHITPNQISIFSVINASLAGLCFYEFSLLPAWWWLLLAPLFIQLRLLCNLMDGLVAVEEGKATPSGELFNDIPDRFSDMFIFVGAGYAVASPILGWLAGTLAVMTFASLLAIMAHCLLAQGALALSVALLVVITGSILTCLKRTRAIYSFLNQAD